MNNNGQTLEQARAIITSACRMLRHAREVTPFFGRDRYAPPADCRVLLSDATKLFCAAVSQHRGEPAGHRWSAALPDWLLAHPEKCDETLALVASEPFPGTAHFEFSAA